MYWENPKHKYTISNSYLDLLSIKVYHTKIKVKVITTKLVHIKVHSFHKTINPILINKWINKWINKFIINNKICITQNFNKLMNIILKIHKLKAHPLHHKLLLTWILLLKSSSHNTNNKINSFNKSILKDLRNSQHSKVK